MKLDILLDNEWFVVINKPSGMLSIPDRIQSEVSLKEILIELYGSIFTVHRLDKDTSGIIVFAKDEASHKQLSQLFEGRDLKKIYLGMVSGTLFSNSGTIDVPIMEHPAKNGSMITHVKGKPSITDYEVVESFGIFSWLQFQIHTGRTHQIRVHAKHLGNSIVCDSLYGDGKPVYISSIKKKYHLAKKEEEERPMLARLGLHSYQLAFTFNNTEYQLEAPIPKDISALLQQLRKWKGNKLGS